MTTSSFRPDIEGLRGIAILSVVLFHARVPGFTGGFIGVDIFFVLSGYLITGILVEEFEKRRSISLMRFYSRRAKRLLPAVSVMLLATIVLSYLIFPPIQQITLPQTAIATALYLSNVYFVHTTTDYLASPPEANPLLHTWSLSVEEQFYFVFPLVTLLALKFTSRRPLLVLIGAIVVVSFGACVYLTSYWQPAAFFSSPARAWEFAAGAFAVLSVSRLSSDRNRWFGWAGLATILASVFVLGRHTIFPGWVALFPVLSTVAVLLDPSVSRVLSSRALQFFGRLSYSWYLWHWVALVFAVAMWGELQWPARMLVVVGALAIAQLSYWLIEHPIRTNSLLTARPSYSVAMAACLTIIAAGSAIVFWQLSRKALGTGEQATFAAAKDMPPGLYDNCDLTLYETTPMECVFGDPTARKTVVLIGDSHALQWFVTLDEISKTEGWRIVTLFKSACGVAEVEVREGRLPRPLYECDEWRTRAFARLGELKPDIVLAAGHQLAAFVDPEYRVPMDAWAAGLNSAFANLKKSGAQVVYITDTPRPGFDILNCLARNEWQRSWRSPASCTFARADGVSDELVNREREIAKADGIDFVDMNKYICPESLCEPVIDGVIVYRDSHHMSTAFGKLLSEPLKRELRKISDPAAHAD